MPASLGHCDSFVVRLNHISLNLGQVSWSSMWVMDNNCRTVADVMAFPHFPVKIYMKTLFNPMNMVLCTATNGGQW